MAGWLVQPLCAGACIPCMFWGAKAFDRDLSNWNIEEATTMKRNAQSRRKARVPPNRMGFLNPVNREVQSILLWCTQRGRSMIHTHLGQCCDNSVPIQVYPAWKIEDSHKHLRRCCGNPVPILETIRRCCQDTSNMVRRCSDDAAMIVARAVRSRYCEGPAATLRMQGVIGFESSSMQS